MTRRPCLGPMPSMEAGAACSQHPVRGIALPSDALVPCGPLIFHPRLYLIERNPSSMIDGRRRTRSAQTTLASTGFDGSYLRVLMKSPNYLLNMISCHQYSVPSGGIDFCQKAYELFPPGAIMQRTANRDALQALQRRLGQPICRPAELSGAWGMNHPQCTYR